MYTLIFLFLASLLLSSCGSKQRNIFIFPEKETLVLHKLDFPVIKGIRVQKTEQGNLITWRPIDEQPDTYNGHVCKFIGYNVYRLARASVIPRRPVNKKALVITSMLDTRNKSQAQQAFYLVRAVFKIDDQTIEGPVSRISSNI